MKPSAVELYTEYNWGDIMPNPIANSDGVSVVYADIAEFPGYRVGTDGSVWSSRVKGRSSRLSSGAWKRLAATPNKKGYPSVNLTPPGGRYKTFRVHSLVLRTFIGLCPSGMEACHKNGVKTDNNLDNLYWGLPERNRDDNHRLGVYACGEDHTQAKLSVDQVAEIRTRYAAGGVFQRELAEEFGVTTSNINAIVRGRSWVTPPPPQSPAGPPTRPTPPSDR